MATITERNREVAYGMFADGQTSERVASRIRKPVESVRALRANWTRNLSSSKVSSSRARSTSTPSPMTITVSRKQLETALKNGQPVQLVVK